LQQCRTKIITAEATHRNTNTLVTVLLNSQATAPHHSKTMATVSHLHSNNTVDMINIAAGVPILPNRSALKPLNGKAE